MRRSLSQAEWQAISTQIQNPALSLADRAALRLQLFLEHETIVKKPGERIPAYRTLKEFPDIYAEGEKEALHKGHHVHEQGRVCNISSDWEGVLKGGLMARYNLVTEASRRTIDAVLAYADRYEMPGLSAALRQGAQGYLEALQAFRILHFSLWASNVYHNTVGRFDQYMYPYFKADLDSGRFTEAELLALTEEFFLSFNRDSDLYTGMQQGDNGQSLMLGGCDRQGNNAVNELTYVCLTASLNNRLIDPKINLRVNKDTPMELYVRCTELTKQGLGFPQYSNDDVVIPGLVALGYSLEDARDYTVAACWEFILPGVAMDIPNIGAVSLAESVHQVIMRELPTCDTFEALQDKVRQELFNRADALENALRPLWIEPAPFQTVLMSDPSHDISLGAKYNNYGIHGTGFATAVDQLSAVERYIYQDQMMPADDWLEALSTAFEGQSDLKHTLRTQAPKLGRDAQSEAIADRLMNDFADSWAGRRNERGGVFRPGTGSAMYYVWHGVGLGALSDGHMPGEPISANYSPSLLVTDVGPLSAISAMARPQLGRVINGGPLTLELHDTVFKNQEALTKVAMLVRSFILLGGHQLQLNAVSRETLLDAQAHPEAHRQLIVRVWGWSGHFIQLDKSYQEQIIERTSYRI